MSASKLIRWGGMALLLGGVMWFMQKISWTLLIGDLDPRAYPQPTATVLWGMGLISALLILLGLPALYARQARQAGRLGFAAFVAVFIGMALVTSNAYFGVFLQAGLVDLIISAEGAGITVEEPVAAGIGFFVSLVLYTLGWLLFALSLLRANILPRWPLAVVIVGLLSGFLFMATGFSLLALPVTEIGIAWLGFSLWQEKSEAFMKAPAVSEAG